MARNDAVSPVVGIVLMVAITVILAAVISAFIFGDDAGLAAGITIVGVAGCGVLYLGSLFKGAISERRRGRYTRAYERYKRGKGIHPEDVPQGVDTKPGARGLLARIGRGL